MRRARGPVLTAALLQAAVLSATSNRYGYHRDELYFRLLRPAWGYVDQPPLTPLLARLTRALLADQSWALRVPATIASAVSVFLVAEIAREVGGGRAAQALAAWGYAFATFPLILGHVFLTASIDEPVWPGVLLLIIRARLRARGRWWLWAGVVVGLGLYNKLLIVVLLAALAAGLFMSGARRVLVSKPVLAGLGVALLIGLSNVVYQATHGWPQWSFGRALAAHHGADVRVSMWPLLVLLLGPPLVAVWVAGWIAVWRRADWRPIRFLAPAFVILVALVFVMGSQPYYEFGLLSALFALGCVPTADWMARGRRSRLLDIAALGTVNAGVSAVIALPLVPVPDWATRRFPGGTRSPATRWAGPPTSARSGTSTGR